MLSATAPDVYSARDIADAAGVSEARVQALISRGEIRSVAAMVPLVATGDLAAFVTEREAVRAVRALRTGSSVAVPDPQGLGRELFASPRSAARPTAVPLAISTSLHGFAAAALAIVMSLGFAVADERTDPLPPADPVRLVFVALPGPGGGGGGGGLKMRTPPPKAQREGVRPISSPLPARRLPPPMRPQPKPPEPPPPIEAKSLPPVMAPVVTSPSDARDVAGVMAQVPDAPPSQGPGTGGGVGSGAGTGLGEGDGAGIGPGSGGGTGGGPYRPGSGVEPPRLLREVKANYTDEGRRANIEGEVLLEIVVRANGTVGDVKVLRGLRGGLSEQAIAAVRQWRFAPARMKGTPVDVVVEVGVEFRLR